MKLRITPDGSIRGLWSDEIDWQTMGPIAVERASHVEFCSRRQCWTVQIGQPRAFWRRMLQRLLGRPFGEIVFTAPTRSEGLAWEEEHFGPGGPYWRR